MEIAAAAVGSLLPKLQAYLLQRGGDDLHRDDAEQLSQQLTSVHAALLDACCARALPPGTTLCGDDGQGQAAWSREARELAYDAEDAVDALLVASPPPPSGPVTMSLKELLRRATHLSRTRPQATGDAPQPAAVGGVPYCPHPPPPLDEAALVGVDGARDGLIRRLRLRDGAGDGDGDRQVEVVPVVGPAGLGKTTLARAAYAVLQPCFDCAAFVSVGLRPDIAVLLESMLRQLGVTVEADADEPSDEERLTSHLRGFLQDKRYFIVLDDLWDKRSWEKIRGALADNNCGSRIIVTTHNLDVADQIGIPYELQPLSTDDSKKLFLRTAFGNEDKHLPDDELTELADKITKKCGGVPLAIITLANVLASKIGVGDKGEWHKVYQSIGSGLEGTPEVKNMRMVASTGYYNLPPHLRACLLHLTEFPDEDYEIRRDRLILRWIAEGLVKSGEDQGESLFELGESYFDELVNRSMIRLIDIDYADDGGPYECCCNVQFPVMDLISYLSGQDNFVTVLRGEPLDAKQVRRVSIRGGSKAEDSASLVTLSMPHRLRSLSIFRPVAVAESIDLSTCTFLRVLDLEGCDLSESDHLQKHLASLIHLRYLGLRDTRIGRVPEDIGNLRSLQTLDLAGGKVQELPASVVQLRQLVCLHVDDSTKVPSGIGSLAALEVLSDVSTREAPPDAVVELGSLTKLRVLRITLWQPSRRLEEALVESLRGLRELHTLDVYVAGGAGGGDESGRLDVVREAWTPPASLREFRARAMNSCRSPLRALLAWVDAPTAPCLAVLVVQLLELRQRDVEALGRLPALRVLRVDPYSGREPLVVPGGAFPLLAECRFRDSDVAPVFRRGAAPRLRRLEFCFRVRETTDLGNGGFEFGLENLDSLEEVAVYVGCQESREPEAEAAEAALRRAADSHPNGASFDVITFGEELMRFVDDE